jgi:hypothetical protein
MEAICSSETLVATQQTTRRHIPEGDTLHNHHCGNLKSYMSFLYGLSLFWQIQVLQLPSSGRKSWTQNLSHVTMDTQMYIKCLLIHSHTGFSLLDYQSNYSWALLFHSSMNLEWLHANIISTFHRNNSCSYAEALFHFDPQQTRL